MFIRLPVDQILPSHWAAGSRKGGLAIFARPPVAKVRSGGWIYNEGTTPVNLTLSHGCIALFKLEFLNLSLGQVMDTWRYGGKAQRGLPMVFLINYRCSFPCQVQPIMLECSPPNPYVRVIENTPPAIAATYVLIMKGTNALSLL